MPLKEVFLDKSKAEIFPILGKKGIVNFYAKISKMHYPPAYQSR
jgi:hypothetical protein